VRVNQASPSDERAWAAIVRLQQGLDYVLGRVIDMAAAQSEFDQAFTDLSEGVNTLIADFRELNAKIQSLPPDGGTPAQLQAVKDLSAKVHAALPVEAPASPAPPVSSTPPTTDAPPTTPPAPTPASPPAVDRTEYTFDGDPTAVNMTEWPPLESRTADGKQLYWYAGDTAPGDAKGDGQGGLWHRYTPLIAAAPAL